MPKDAEGKTLGFAFIEYNTPQVTLPHLLALPHAQELLKSWK